MAPVKITDVICFSSEDAKYTVENMIYGKEKWLCSRDDDSLQLEAIFQLEKAVKISYIDVGNFGTAFLEVYVKRSLQKKGFVLLLPTATLMTPDEQKSGTNLSGVTMFTNENFIHKVSEEKWDQIKVVCRLMPIAAKKQFGISFLVVRTKDIESNVNDLSQLSTIENRGSPERHSGVREERSTHISSSSLSRKEVILSAALALKQYKSKTPSLKPKVKEVGRQKYASKKAKEKSSPKSPESPSGILSEIAKRALRYSPESVVQRKEGKRGTLVSKVFIEEVECFLEDFNFHLCDLNKVRVLDLRLQMEKQRGCSLTPTERKIFFKMAEKAVRKYGESKRKRNEIKDPVPKSGVKEDLVSEHLALDLEQFPCPYCNDSFAAIQIVQHTEQCALKTSESQNDHCNEEHLDVVFCEKCLYSVPITDFAAHDDTCTGSCPSEHDTTENKERKSPTGKGTLYTRMRNVGIRPRGAVGEYDIKDKGKVEVVRRKANSPWDSSPVRDMSFASQPSPEWVAEQTSELNRRFRSDALDEDQGSFFVVSSSDDDGLETSRSSSSAKTCSRSAQGNGDESSQNGLIQCPLCNDFFTHSIIMVHANICADIKR